ncbi:MAG: enoyl-CoA hydratase-related protein [Salinisphaeraceae bacterium]|nr:enoyl-CoA hydratase-related protein [Salinisphaeraceae bacterium]
MSYETLIYEVSDKVALISLNRPQQLNALNSTLLREINEALTQAEEDDNVGAIVLTGEGRGFSSGADITDPNDMPFDEAGKLDLSVALHKRYHPIIERMRGMPKPIIGAANGIAAGAGCSLIINADITLAARSASFLLAFVNIGLVPDAGATWLMPQRIGTQRYLGMAMLGEKLPAETAKEWGLIWEVVDDENLRDEAIKMASKLANGPALSIDRIKRTAYAAAENDLPTQLNMEADLQRECGQSEDFTEGVQAFMQKRPAQFKGR